MINLVPVRQDSIPGRAVRSVRPNLMAYCACAAINEHTIAAHDGVISCVKCGAKRVLG